MALSVRPKFNTWNSQEQAQRTLESQFGFGQAVAENAVAGYLSTFGAGTLTRELMTPQPNTPITDEAPFLSELPRAIGDIGAMLRGDKPEPTMTPEEFDASPDKRNGFVYEEGITAGRLAAKAAMFDVDEARAMMSQKEWGGAFIGQFLGQALDPINYVPFTGQATQAAAVARAGGILGRIGVSAVDAAISTAVFGVATAQWRKTFGDNISFEAMAQEVIMSAVIGGAFGAGVGVLSIPGDRRAREQRILNSSRAVAQAESLRDVYGRVAILKDGTGQVAAGRLDDGMMPGARAEFERQVAKFQENIRIQEERDIGRAVEARTITQRAEIEEARAELATIPAESPRAVELSQRVVELETYVQQTDVAYRANRELVARGIANEPGGAAAARALPPVADGMTRIYSTTDPAADMVAGGTEAPASSRRSRLAAQRKAFSPEAPDGDGWYADVPTEGTEVSGQPMAWQQIPKPEAPPVSPFRRLLISRFMEGRRSGEEGLALAKMYESAYANLSSRAGWTPEKMLQEYPLPEVVYRAADSAEPDTLNQKANTVEDLKMVAVRGERVMGTKSVVSAEEKAAIKTSAAQTGVPAKDIEAAVRKSKLAFPQSQGWAELVYKKTVKEVNDDNPDDVSIEHKYVEIPYGFSSLDGKGLAKGTPAYEKRADSIANGLLEDVRSIYRRAQTGDKNAKNILAQAAWYKAMRTRLRKEFGGLGDLFADLLGATSPNTPVRDNWSNAVTALRRAARGDYDAMMPEWEAWAKNIDDLETDAGAWFTERQAEFELLERDRQARLNETTAARASDRASYEAAGRAEGRTLLEIRKDDAWKDMRRDELAALTTEKSAYTKAAIKALPEYQRRIEEIKAARVLPDRLLPTKESGKNYGFNGRHIVRAMLDLWRVVKAEDPDLAIGGTKPKALNFSGNLIGFRKKATIDVWAARLLQRLSGGRRIPPAAETSVRGNMLPSGETTDQFGFGQEVFSRATKLIRGDAELRADDGLSRINDDDLQAVVWFIEKELWTQNNWTNSAGEGGSFELEADLTGPKDQAGIRELRRVIDSSKSTPAQIESATKQLAASVRTVDRLVGGLSIQMSKGTQGVDWRPTDAAMVRLGDDVRSAIYEADSDNLVLMSKALATEGRYGTIERSLDLEVVAREGYDPNPLWRKIVEKAKEYLQDATFLARVLRDSEDVDPLVHRPGIEVYFDSPAARDKLEEMLERLKANGVKDLTVVVDGRRSGQATRGEMGPAVGVRIIHTPEFDQRYGDDSWLDLTDDQIAQKTNEKRSEMARIAEEVSNIEGVSFAQQVWYETRVAFRSDYDEVLGNGEDIPTGRAEGEPAGMPGQGGWRGESIREGTARADRHARKAESAGEPDVEPDLGGLPQRGPGQPDDTFNQGGRRAGGYSLGKLAPLEGAPNVEGASGPDLNLIPVAEQYARENGIDLRRQSEFVEVDPDRAARIAAAYDAMPHAPDDPKVKAAYQELIRQTVDQYRALEAAGFKFWLFDGATDPYGGNPWNAMRDLRKNKTMGVYATADGFGSGATELDVSQNPLLVDTGIRWPAGTPDGPLQPVLANDLFRAVHDAFGHGIEGAGFRARGEENAWQAHSRLFYGDALGAITSETRGQNSWLNYGPHGEKNRTAKVEDTVFADQKTGLMPEWTWREGRAGDAPDDTGRASDELIFQQAGSRVLQRTPELQDAARAVAAGEMTPEAYTALVERYKPVTPYADVPEPASVEDMQRALTSDKVGRIGATDQLEAGHKVGLRLDIPAYANNGVWVVSVHEQQAGFSAGPSIGYTSVARASNVTMGVVEKAALAIAQGKPKGTIATIKGDWVPSSPEEAKAAAAAALADPAWRQAGMDPERASFFYDRETMQPITAAEEVIQIGPLVLAKNPTYADTGSFLYQPAYHGSPKVFDKFKWSDEIRGTGEGAQAFGDGLYFAGKKAVAEHYRDTLSSGASLLGPAKTDAERAVLDVLKDFLKVVGGRDDVVNMRVAVKENYYAYLDRDETRDLIDEGGEPLDYPAAFEKMVNDGRIVDATGGRLYKVDIPGDDELLNWDARLYDQPAILEKIDAALAKMGMSRDEIEDTIDQDPRVATGAQFYKALAEVLGDTAPEGLLVYKVDPTRRLPNEVAASRFLRDAGIPGHRFLDGQSRSAGEGTYNYVIYDDSRVDIIDYEQEVRNDASTWEPDTGRSEEPRGQIQFKDKQSLMKMFDGADSSTALHESGHHFLMMIKSMAERTDTGPGIKEDWAQVKSWLAVNAKDVAREAGANISPDDVLGVLNKNTSGDRMKDIAINRAIHEQWARGFEAYLLEGKSPSTGMRDVFESFKKWLAAIYSSAKALNVNLTPEIRQVFDRLLTDEAATPERAVVTAPERPAGAPTLDPPPVERADAGLVTAAAAVGKSENVAGFEEQIGAKLDGTYTEEGDIEMLRSLGRVLPEEEAMLKQADDGYADAVAYEKAIKVALACVIP